MAGTFLSIHNNVTNVIYSISIIFWAMENINSTMHALNTSIDKSINQ